jgi:hypothetical protein
VEKLASPRQVFLAMLAVLMMQIQLGSKADLLTV